MTSSTKQTTSEKSLQLGSFKVTVHKATHRMSITRAALSYNAENQWEGRSVDGLEEQLLHYDEAVLYPALAACSTGKRLPTYEDFSNMSEEDSKTWIDAAMELNPTWFPGEQQIADSEELQKKDNELITSTLDSVTSPSES